MIFKEYKDWIDDNEHVDVLTQIVYQPKWRFGQTSDNTIEPNYPMWFQNFYHNKEFKFIYFLLFICLIQLVSPI